MAIGKKEGRKIFRFKDENYSVYDLISFYSDSRLKEFKEGEVTNLTNGSFFDIKDIKKELNQLNKDVIDNAEHLSYYERAKLRNMLSDDENEKRKFELNVKLNNDTINIEELKELMFLEGDEFGEGYVKVTLFNEDFIKLNQKSLFPEELKDGSLGKFLRLLMLTTYKNEIKRTNRENSNNITKSELMKYLKISNDKTFVSVFTELEKYDLLYRKQKAGKGFVIFVNPFYANRNNKFILDKTQYKMFKDDLDSKLPKRITTYLSKNSNKSGLYVEVDEG